MGLQLPVTMALFAAIGYGVDWKFGSKPWGTIVGVFAGLATGAYQLVQLVKWDQTHPPKDPDRP